MMRTIRVRRKRKIPIGKGEPRCNDVVEDMKERGGRLKGRGEKRRIFTGNKGGKS